MCLEFIIFLDKKRGHSVMHWIELVSHQVLPLEPLVEFSSGRAFSVAPGGSFEFPSVPPLTSFHFSPWRKSMDLKTDFRIQTEWHALRINLSRERSFLFLLWSYSLFWHPSLRLHPSFPPCSLQYGQAERAPLPREERQKDVLLVSMELLILRWVFGAIGVFN